MPPTVARLAAVLVAVAQAADVVVDQLEVHECSDKQRAAAGDTLAIEHQGFLGATQIDSSPEG
eukprot:4300192-Prymnesium_polylepis.2